MGIQTLAPPPWLDRLRRRVLISRQQRRIWTDWLRDELRRRSLLNGQGNVSLSPTGQRANNALLVPAKARVGGGEQQYWLKWLPKASPDDLRSTVDHLNWWSSRHRHLAGVAPSWAACWPDNHLLLVPHAAGTPLEQLLKHDVRETQLHEYKDAGGTPPRFVRNIAEWLRQFHGAGTTYGHDIVPLLAEHATRTSDGRLKVDSIALLERRLNLANEAIAHLVERGVTEASKWIDLSPSRETLLTAAAPYTNAGFIHGDFNPGNIIIDRDAFRVIDWWTSPRVSWPLQDVATLGGNCWMMDTEGARRFWLGFKNVYFEAGATLGTQTLLETLAAMMCLSALEQRTRSAAQRLLTLDTTRYTLRRLLVAYRQRTLV